jgi:hypothetical protein
MCAIASGTYSATLTRVEIRPADGHPKGTKELKAIYEITDGIYKGYTLCDVYLAESDFVDTVAQKINTDNKDVIAEISIERR